MQMKDIFKVTAFALAFGASAAALAAGVRMQTVEAIGTGPTRTDAINAALVEAVSQVSGTKIAARDEAKLATASETRAINDQEETASLTYEEATHEVQTETEGFVRRYQILNIDEEPQTQLVRAKLSVDVNYFDKGKATQRMRIVVLPFKVAASTVSPQDQKQFLLNVNQAAVDYLTSTRHFAIVDRDFEGDRMNELAILFRPDVPKEERARLGNTLAADYIVTGRVLEFSADNKTAKDPYTGETVTTTNGQVTVQWRLVEAATGQVSVSGSETLPIRAKNAVTQNGNAIGRGIGEQISETIFPIAALGYQNGQLIIGQGGETIRPGELYSLMQQGAIRKDPYTGEQMGRDETPVGEVRILRVTPKMSYGQVLNCEVDLKGMAPREYLLRKADSNAGTNAPGAPGAAPAASSAQPAW